MRKRMPVLILLLVALILSAVVVITSVLASASVPQESGASQMYRVTGTQTVPEASLNLSDDPSDDGIFAPPLR